MLERDGARTDESSLTRARGQNSLYFVRRSQTASSARPSRTASIRAPSTTGNSWGPQVGEMLATGTARVFERNGKPLVESGP